MKIVNRYPFEFIINKSEFDLFDYYNVMESSGNAFARAYLYHDQETIVLSDLNVSINWRSQNLGTMLQEIRESIGIEIGCTSSMLFCKEKSWMFDWYQRRGYNPEDPYEELPGHVWMRKELIK